MKVKDLIVKLLDAPMDATVTVAVSDDDDTDVTGLRYTPSPYGPGYAEIKVVGNFVEAV